MCRTRCSIPWFRGRSKRRDSAATRHRTYNKRGGKSVLWIRSVANPECLSRIRIFIQDPGPASKNLSNLTPKIVSKLEYDLVCSYRIRILIFYSSRIKIPGSSDLNRERATLAVKRRENDPLPAPPPARDVPLPFHPLRVSHTCCQVNG